MADGIVRTTCPYCGVGCGLRVTAGGVRCRRPGPSRPIWAAVLERRGARRNAVRRRTLAVSADRRPGAPLGRGARPGRRAISPHDRRARAGCVALYVSGQLLTEDYYVANKLMKGFIGTANIDTNSRLCMASSVAGHKRAFGEDIVPGCYEDMELADLVVLVGCNAAWCHPVLFQRLAAAKEKRGTKIVVIDPRATADLRACRPASAIAARHRCGALHGLLVASRSERCVRSTGWMSELHAPGFAAALELRQRQRTSHRRGGGRRTVRDARSRAILRSGSLRHERTVTALLPGREPVLRRHRQGQRDHQLPSRDRAHRPAGHGAILAHGPAQCDGRARGRRPCQHSSPRIWSFADPADRRSRAALLEGPAHGRPEPGLKAVDLFDAVLRGRIKALWIIGTNPADSMPRADAGPRGARRCPFVVVSDCWPTDTTRFARMSCCRPPAGARRTARSPIPSGASRASAPSARAPAKRGRTGGCWPKWRDAWVGARGFSYRTPGRDFRGACRAYRRSRTLSRTGAFSTSARFAI